MIWLITCHITLGELSSEFSVKVELKWVNLASCKKSETLKSWFEKAKEKKIELSNGLWINILVLK